MSENFVHLHVHSAYSLAEGAIKVKDLVKLCANNNMPAVAVTDTNNLFGAMEFAQEAAEAGIQPIFGCQVQLEDGTQLVLIAQTELGYKNLCKLTSSYFMDKITHDSLKKFSAGIICLTGGIKGAIAQALLHGQTESAETEIKKLKEVYGDRLYIEL
ncbi:MAG: PHP domain-containing protein, partial [Alphaproteobacteria bacterium]|nr:PHP domain-containing protein [Alphaproteobacteria bacterium]